MIRCDIKGCKRVLHPERSPDGGGWIFYVAGTSRQKTRHELWASLADAPQAEKP